MARIARYPIEHMCEEIRSNGHQSFAAETSGMLFQGTRLASFVQKKSCTSPSTKVECLSASDQRRPSGCGQLTRNDPLSHVLIAISSRSPAEVHGVKTCWQGRFFLAAERQVNRAMRDTSSSSGGFQGRPISIRPHSHHRTPCPPSSVSGSQ